MEFASVMDFLLTMFLFALLLFFTIILFAGCYVCIEMRDEIRKWRNRSGNDDKE